MTTSAPTRRSRTPARFKNSSIANASTAAITAARVTIAASRTPTYRHLPEKDCVARPTRILLLTRTSPANSSGACHFQNSPDWIIVIALTAAIRAIASSTLASATARYTREPASRSKKRASARRNDLWAGRWGCTTRRSAPVLGDRTPGSALPANVSTRIRYLPRATIPRFAKPQWPDRRLKLARRRQLLVKDSAPRRANSPVSREVSFCRWKGSATAPSRQQKTTAQPPSLFELTPRGPANMFTLATV